MTKCETYLAPSTQSPEDIGKRFDIRGRMSKRHHKEWIDALRGDGYLQGQSQLMGHDEDTGEDSFCCLGVFLNLREEEYGPHAWEEGREEEMISSEKAEEWGLQLSGETEHQVLQSYLAHLNDNDRSFNEIADWLEDNEYWVTGEWENAETTDTDTSTQKS